MKRIFSETWHYILQGLFIIILLLTLPILAILELTGYLKPTSRIKRRIRRLTASKQKIYEELFAEIVYYTKRQKGVSTSQLIKKFELTYLEAGTFIDKLEEKGIIGSATGANGRNT